jgi:hypothetical protein
MLHKNFLRNKIEKKMTQEVINDLFNIFIFSQSEEEFYKEIEKQKYKNKEKLWQIFYPKYEKYRQENLQRINK